MLKVIVIIPLLILGTIFVLVISNLADKNIKNNMKEYEERKRSQDAV